MGGSPEEAHGLQQGLNLEGPIQFPRPVVDAFSGAVAGGVARVAIAPLDVIKIRFQVQLEPLGRGQVSRDGVKAVVHSASKYTGVLQAARSIYLEEGIRGLWRGTVPGLILVMPYTAIQFTVMLRFKTLVAGSTKGVDHLELSPVLSYVGGAVAGSAATLGSYPFDLLRTTLAAQGNPPKYPTMRAAAVDIFRRRGIRGLYAGLTPTLFEIIPYAGIQFGAYDSLKRAMMAYNAQKYGEDGPAHSVGAANLTTPQHFMIGLGAGLIAKTATHPLDVIKKRFQVRGLERHPSYGKRVDETAYRGIVSTARHIIQTEGVRGVYKGIWPSVIKAAPNAAIIFAVYEKVSHWLEPFVNHTEGERLQESRPH